MPYNNVISRADAADLIPEEVSNAILNDIAGSNPLLQMARRLPNMSRSQVRMPIMSALATAYFVNGDTGLKQTSEVNWTHRHIDAEELAVIVPIPQSVLDDIQNGGYDVWGQVKPSIVQAFGIAITQAVLYGTNIPATWSVNLGGAGICVSTVTGGASPATHIISAASYTDWYEALLGRTVAGVSGAFMLCEADGFAPNGILGHVSLKGILRNERDTDGNLLFKTSVQTATDYSIEGLPPVKFPDDGSITAATSLAVVGDWTKLIYAMRQDISYTVADQGVIQDAAGNIVYNLFQQDMVALRATMRLGFALPNPMTRLGAGAATQFPFVTVTA
jgi:hypothetical protein